MIIQSVDGPKIQRNGDFKEAFFSLKNEVMIFEILRSKIYTDPIKAIVREIVSNAIDANGEAGRKNEKVFVHFPNSEEPYFSIRDVGPGISVQRMFEIFIGYGESTKRNTNTQIGYYGLGSKSPFSYSDSFYIITKNEDGIQREYLAYIDETKQGKLSVINETILELPFKTGTEIKINVKSKDFGAFEEAFKVVCRYMMDKFEFETHTSFEFNEKYISLNNILPPDVWAKPVTFNRYYYSQKESNGKTTILNGNIPYVIDIDNIRNLMSLIKKNITGTMVEKLLITTNTIIKFPVGLLSLPPNRETLNENKTNAHLIYKKLMKIDRCINSFFNERLTKKFLENLSLYRLFYIQHQAMLKTFKDIDDIYDPRRIEFPKEVVLWEFNQRVEYYKASAIVPNKNMACLYRFTNDKNSKNRVRRFYSMNKWNGLCFVFTFSSEKDVETFKKNYKMLNLIPLRNFEEEVEETYKEERSIDGVAKDLFPFAFNTIRDSSTTTHRPCEDYVDLPAFYIVKEYSDYIFYSHNRSVFDIQEYTLDIFSDFKIPINYPVFIVNKSNIKKVHKKWILLDQYLQCVIEHGKDFSENIIHSIINKTMRLLRNKYDFVDRTSHLNEILQEKYIGQTLPHNKYIECSNFGIILEKNQHVRSLIVKSVIGMRKIIKYVVDNFPEFFAFEYYSMNRGATGQPNSNIYKKYQEILEKIKEQLK